MNKRIADLFAQALDAAVPETWTTLNPVQLMRLRDKFAELIVRECISKCEFIATMAAVTNNDDEISRKCEATANSCAMMIRQHFGVEE